MKREPQPCENARIAVEEVDTQEITLRRSETRTTSVEECETRVANGRRFQKRTTTSELHESKTEVHESNAPIVFPTVTCPATRCCKATSKASAPPPLAQQIKLTIANIESADGVSGARFVGDYLLDLVSGSESPRWELSFPAQSGLFKAELVAMSLGDGRQRFKAGLSGLQNGPEWRGESTELQGPIVLRFAPELVGQTIAGCVWPSHVTITPLSQPIAKSSFHIPTESSLEDLLILSRGSSGSANSAFEEFGSGSGEARLVVILEVEEADCDSLPPLAARAADCGSGSS